MPFQIKKSPTKIAICGTGSSWNLLPIQSDHTIYCLNDYVKTERYGVQPDVLFVMDLIDEKPQVVSGIDNLGDIIQRINQMGVPLIAPFKYAEIPKSEAFPLEECVKEFGLAYFTNTICYMIFYALLKGAKEIDIFGVNQAGSHEYAEEKGGVEYAIGVAIGRGVKVTINGKDSQLLKYKGKHGNYLYGYFQSYENIIDSKKRFGEPIVYHLFKPPQPISRTVRVIKE